MTPPQPISISAVFAGMGTAAESNRTFLIRMTLIAAAFSTTLVPLQDAGVGGFAISLGLDLLLRTVFVGFVSALICLPGGARSSGQLWAEVQPRLSTLIWVTLVIAITVGVTILLIVPPFILLTIWAVAVPVVVVEKVGVFESLSRSRALVRGNGWRVFLFIIALAVFAIALAIVGLLLALPLGTGMLGRMVGTFLTVCAVFPLIFLGPAVLYNKLAGEPAERAMVPVTPPTVEP